MSPMLEVEEELLKKVTKGEAVAVLMRPGMTPVPAPPVVASIASSFSSAFRLQLETERGIHA